MADALTWSGTFHAIGARFLREYAEQIGLDRAFTIHGSSRLPLDVRRLVTSSAVGRHPGR